MSTVLFVNGVSNTPEQAKKSAKELSKLSCCPVETFYNPRSMIHDDATELAEKIKSLVGAWYGVCLISHSHGAKLTLDALKKVKDDQGDLTKKNITVFTYGGATNIGNGFGKKVLNVRNSGDLVQVGGQVIFGWTNSGTSDVENHSGGNHSMIDGYGQKASEHIFCFKLEEFCWDLSCCCLPRIFCC